MEIFLFCTIPDAKTFDVPCDTHFATLLLPVRFTAVSDIVCAFCIRSLIPKWRTAESYLSDSRDGLTYCKISLES